MADDVFDLAEVSRVKVEAIAVEDVKIEEIREEEIKAEEIKHEDIKDEDIKHEDIKVENIDAEHVKVEQETTRDQLLVNNSTGSRQLDGAMIKREDHPYRGLDTNLGIRVKRERSASVEAPYSTPSPFPAYSHTDKGPGYPAHLTSHRSSHVPRPESPARLRIKRERSEDEDEEVPLRIRESDSGSRDPSSAPKRRSNIQTAVRERVMER